MSVRNVTVLLLVERYLINTQKKTTIDLRVAPVQLEVWWTGAIPNLYYA
jgi:hypothetical protein